MPTARALFDMVDSQDYPGLAGCLAEDATMVFGNAEPLLGRNAIVAANQAFLEQLKAIRHQLRNEWTVGDTTIAQTEVTYTRLDGKEVTLPAVSIWHHRAGLITDLRVFYDPAPIFTA